MIMTQDNNDIKHRDARQLNAYLDTLTYWERVEFVTAVMRRVGARRQTFFNREAMACRIPERTKEIIENEAGECIFVDIIPSEQPQQP